MGETFDEITEARVRDIAVVDEAAS
jgi:hypothetical protein